ncbi:PD-(D/E)XK nuclease family protein [bacterium]|nr:PD-(D/E)XK nuclease family protein [bacterium]
MAMKDKLVFSQASLQDYLDCKRRFYYRYIEHLSWPAVEAEPVMENEQRMIQGANFHQLVNQYYLGIPEDLLCEMAKTANVATWWEHFIAETPVSRQGKVYTEKLVSYHLNESRLVAKFDLISRGEDGKIRIYDWKTSQKRPHREYVAVRMQTRVYPYLAAQTARQLFPGGVVEPEQIEMVYWYVNFPREPEIFKYSTAEMERDEKLLQETIAEVLKLEGREDFPLTDNVKQCQYCVYRSLCDRGSGAGDWESFDPEFAGSEDIQINFDEIEEIQI